jgi:hypothetical protein
MFLWVKFQLLELQEAVTESDVENVLKQLPRTLGETYARIINKIYRGPGGKIKIETMQAIFRWIAGARRPLRLDELEEAVGLRPTDKCLPTERIARNAGKKLVGDCGNLVTCHEEDGTVSFAHHTVLQYLRNETDEQQTTPIHLKLDVSMSAEYIGQICLAYLSFADFEIQIAQAPQQIELPRETVEGLLWRGVPFAARIKNSLGRAHLSSILPQQQPQLPLAVKFPLHMKSSNTWNRKFRLLDYVITYWVFHTSWLTTESPDWSLFLHIVLVQNLLFDFRPWDEPQHHAKVDKVLQTLQTSKLWKSKHQTRDPKYLQNIIMYSWAIANGVASVLALVEVNTMSPYLNLAATGSYQPGKAPTDDIKAYDSLLVGAIEQKPSSQHLHTGFWNGHFVYSAASLGPFFLKYCSREYSLWASSGAHTLDMLLEDAIVCAVQKEDWYTFRQLVSYHVRDTKRLISTLISLVLSKQAKGFAIIQLFRNHLGDMSDGERLEIIFILQHCVPTVHLALLTDSQAINIGSRLLKSFFLIATLILSEFAPLSTIVPALGISPDLLELLESADWRSTCFGTEEAFDRLVRLQQCEFFAIRESLSGYVKLLQNFHALQDQYTVSTCTECKALCKWCICHLDIFGSLLLDELGISKNTSAGLPQIGHAFYNYSCGSMFVREEYTPESVVRFAMMAPEKLWQFVLALPLPETVVRQALQRAKMEDTLQESPRLPQLEAKL